MTANFRSDNEYPVAPQIMQALAVANDGAAHAYGSDAWTERLRRRFADLFERELAVFPLVSGTAANALAVAQSTPSIGAVICHRDSHLHTDECGAPEFFTGGAKLLALDGADGKLDAGRVADAIAVELALGEHASRPRLLTLTQATELGTVYGNDETASLAACAHGQGLKVHMDGARFANALVTLGCSPAEATWRSGVDFLSFGATKNGAMMAEALVVFDPSDAEELPRRRKQAGHLISKMRFVSAQLEAYLQDDLWLRLAANANAKASELGEGLASVPGAQLLHPVQSNEVFVRLDDGLVAGLRAAGFQFHPWPHAGPGAYRLVTSFATPPEAVPSLLAAARGLTGGPEVSAGR